MNILFDQIVLGALFALATTFAAAKAGVPGDGIPLPEHPRPDFERKDWANLNGDWHFTFDKTDVGEREAWYRAADAKFPLAIRVPFGWGTPLSGVGDEADVGWYRRAVTVPKGWKGRRVFLVIGASDHDTIVWAGAKMVGRHFGGYTPFEVELTEYVDFEGGKPLPVTIRVWDEPAAQAVKSWRLYGKQGYGNVRGIWQTVYLEARSETYLESVRFTSDLAKRRVTAELMLGAPAKRPMTATVVLDDRTALPQPAVGTVKPGERTTRIELPLRNPQAWTPEMPHLYAATVSLRSLEPKRVTDAQQAVLGRIPDAEARERTARYQSLRDPGLGLDFAAEDTVRTYFGYREISTGRLPGTDIPYVTLNGRPIYLRMALDQSYHPTGFYTFPTDGFMRNEIRIAKNLGLNGLRIHIKAEIPRKLYWADRLGLLVMADVPCAWGEPDPRMFAEHWATFEDMVKRDFNHPSIFSWVLFNETWGLITDEANRPEGRGRLRGKLPATQRRVAACYFEAKRLDPTRLVEDDSPCNRDHVVTDLNSWHGYVARQFWESHVKDVCTRDTFVGSGAYHTDGFVQTGAPMINSECGAVWGYEGSTGDCDWSWDYHVMMNAFRRHPELAGWVYTEHHDVTNEWNGYVRFDRSPKETGLGDLFPGMSLRDLHADAYLSPDAELCRSFAAGAVWTVPVDLSLLTERLAGRRLILRHFVRWTDDSGKGHGTEPVEDMSFTAKAWQTGRLADVRVTLPATTACGTVCFALEGDSGTVARNFCCFVTKGEASSRRVTCPAGAYAAAEWSGKTWRVLDGKKACGAGRGYFTYVFDMPKDAKGAVFRAEVSAKRLNGKDAANGDRKGNDLDFMVGGGDFDRSRNPNAYPMTSREKHPSRLRVTVNGAVVKEMVLPDDPADHRGILSWHAQPLDQRLYEAGSYGYLVEAAIPAEVLKNAKDGHLTVRLEGSDGLAVYGANFGRYPLDPTVEFDFVANE